MKRVLEQVRGEPEFVQVVNDFALQGQEEGLRAGVPPAPEPAGRLWTSNGVRALPSLPGDWAAFYRTLAGGFSRGTVPVDARDAVQVLQVLEAARRSAASREVVQLT